MISEQEKREIILEQIKEQVVLEKQQEKYKKQQKKIIDNEVRKFGSLRVINTY